MRRLALVLVGLAIALAVPVAVLVVRALESAAVEAENRHRLVAERAFDEMETSLSRFLEEEEARPFDAYRFYPEGLPPRRSPLAGPPELPFVVGYFQIDPDGSLHTPRIPRDPALAEARGDFAPSLETRQLRPTLEAAWRDAEPARADRGPVRDPVGQGQKSEARELDSYSVYNSFNLAQKRRQERQAKVARVPERALAASPPAPPRASERPYSVALEEAAAGDAAPLRDRARAQTSVRVALDPMLGRAAPGERLILYRTVVAGEQAYRQGLLVDWRGLGNWLDEQVVAASGLARAEVRTSFFAAGTEREDAEPADGYRFRHRFAEPFDAFGVEMLLPPLPGGRGTGTIHALAALLCAVAAIGLFAVYRMAAVVVRFAEQRSRLAASVSHELKTPLTSIRMYAEMLRDGLVASEDKRAEYYRTLTDESERLSRLIDNVLEFSRLERGEAELRASRGDLRAVVTEAVAKLRPHVERQGFTLCEELGEERLEAVFDADAVTQIVFNAVDNALKYAHAGSPPEIELRCGREGDQVVLRVRDHGPGLPAAERSRIFEPFYRGEEEATRGTRGSGIGLALVRELAQSMNGSARADEAVGGGLELSVRLPRAPSS